MTLAYVLIAATTVLASLTIVVRSLERRARDRAQLQREIAMHERQTAAPTSELAAATQALVSAVAPLERATARPGPSREGQRVTVHTKDERTLFGLVVGDYTDRLTLDDAEYVTGDGARPLPGRQDVATENIAWIDAHGKVTTTDLPAANAASA